MPHPPAIRAQGLVGTRSGARTVHGLDLLVRPGETFALLGPPGAGKSSAIAVLSTLAPLTDGSLWIAGHDVRTAPDAVRRSIGVVMEEPALDDALTVEENLRLHAALHSVPRRWTHRRVAAMLALTELLESRHAPVRMLTGQAKRCLDITRALLHHPPVLLLDEPTADLDPHGRAQVWRHLRRMRRECGTTVLLTTRRTEEARDCDRLALIDRGRVVVSPDTAAPPSPHHTNKVFWHHAIGHPHRTRRAHT